MDVIGILKDYNIIYKTENHKHCRPGWVNIPCPFCISEFGHDGYHLGFTLDGSQSACWRCGGKHPTIALSKVLGISGNQLKDIINQYGGNSRVLKDAVVKIGIKPFKYPANVSKMSTRHKKYLEKRNFDPEKIENLWGVLGTNIISILKTGNNIIDYKNRLLVPIYWNGKIVTFQTRDITDKSDYRYLACPQERELIHHKHILYGKSKYMKNTGILVEGITDVWRLGIHSAATFGIKYTPKQLRVISKLYNRVAVIFDDDPQAITQANILVSELKFRGVDAFRISIKGDPGSMEQSEADYLVKQIILK